MTLSDRDQRFVDLVKWALDRFEHLSGLRLRTPRFVVRLLSVEGVRDLLRMEKVPDDRQSELTRFRKLRGQDRYRRAERLSKEWSQ